MKKTYVTTMPDYIGAFLKASKCFASLGMNITRTSYNKAIDINTLFIEAEGTPEQHCLAAENLKAIGYLDSPHEQNVVLLEFRLEDTPGSVEQVLQLINDYCINISYISSQENGTGYQLFKMGLFVDAPSSFDAFYSRVSTLCKVRIIDYNHSEKVYDNSIFYNSFVSELIQDMSLSAQARDSLLIDANMAMQMLDERGLSPYRTFDNISRFAGMLAKSKGDNYCPRITVHQLSVRTSMTLIEPPCGSNTMILKSSGECLFIDSGYACYEKEHIALLTKLLPEFYSIRKRILVTHADVDHCGLLNHFDDILVNSRTYQSLANESDEKNGFREENPLHKPYISICKTLTSYHPVAPERMQICWQSPENRSAPLMPIGFFSFGDLFFEVYEGAGGHLPGEVILIDYEHKIAFTGDVYVNLKAMTPEQSEYNRCAPILMTSVDTDARLCAQERECFFARLGPGSWSVFGAHGGKLSWNVISQT